ncbi:MULTISPECIES: hypothetical protein [Streptomyces]|uniref:Uncharacterized protein n=2 Tax=Streptomyces rimosus subsp. rimosus TaxID=132474 RepID=L8EX81_STRR1|nr:MULTISPECIES: hypothetical protein [Streptomyces]KOG71047.1 hypothetical protein ADK78_26690 [Kitasatospora aureofaciens]MYT47791.1 hypothetical protein [Streptomyces sp. SID5471]KEF03256.1 hypothetical protein DF17_29570 [Streptomyces rimosus]KEF19128.1 hypothetical protein DF18_19980 [Streptomyces rimosus]KOT34128.1 hypothetical protein ADK42_22720 [Streptomyces rimosus subsp. rimosus]
MLRHASRTTATVVATATAVALGLTLTAASAVPAAAATQSTSIQPSSADLRTDPNGRYTAEEIRRFLVSFYGKHGPSAWQREHQVSAELKKKAAETPDYDLLLCAQNTPRNITVGKVTTAQSARVGWATITTYWSGNRKQNFTAYVDLDATRPIELLDVSCSV